jgi:DNA-binding response OmpR family regulator
MAKILLIQAPPYPHDDMVGHRLKSRGYDVILAETGELGLSMAVSEQPNLITIDLSSRQLDGTEIIRAIEADPRIASIPTLALMDSSKLVEGRESIRVLGYDDYDCKPIEMARIVPKIEALLANSDRFRKAEATPTKKPPAVTEHPLKAAIRAFVPAFPGANILIIDDSQINREMLTAWLKAVGFNPIAANGGAEGIAILQKYPIELVLLDVIMPVMSGLECLKQIRLEHPQATLPVLMATSRDGSKEMVEAFELGANDYLLKPLDLSVSLARIDNHLRMAAIASGMLESPESTDLSNSNPEELFSVIPTGVQSHSTLPLVDSSQPFEHPVALNRYKICQALSQAPRYSKYLIEDIEDANPSSYILKHLDLRSSNITTKTLIHHLFLTEINTFRDFPTNGPVAKLLKSGHNDGQYFLIEECIQGQSLSAEIHTQGSLVMRKVLATTIDLLEILVALHRKSIVHQTLQPSSFIRRSDGRLVLNDVGIFARLNIRMERSIDKKGSKFRANHTPYAAPEQDLGSVEPSNDIYSIGLMMLELLTRKQPDWWLKDPVSNRIVWEKTISVGTGLGHIINRMLAPAPRDRYSTAIEALEDVYNLPMVAMLREHGRSLM